MTDCRRRPPQVVCVACRQENDDCTGYCRDAFVYDPARTDAEILELMRTDYTIGGQGGPFEIGVKVPERILAQLE